MFYETYLRNHVVLPDSRKPLHTFLNTTINVNGKEKKHKLEKAFNSNSEDALTWSCFDVLRNQSQEKIGQALNEIMEDAFDGKVACAFENERNIKIHIGKNYYTNAVDENTELDASIETDDKLIFIEAKLYGTISLPGKDKPFDQLIKKIRVGLDVAKHENKKFYFIFLDIAPIDYTLKFGEKSVNAEYFKQYKDNRNALSDKLIHDSYQSLEEVSQNMGWLTWACLFKTVMRTVIQ